MAGVDVTETFIREVASRTHPLQLNQGQAPWFAGLTTPTEVHTKDKNFSGPFVERLQDHFKAQFGVDLAPAAFKERFPRVTSDTMVDVRMVFNGLRPAATVDVPDFAAFLERPLTEAGVLCKGIWIGNPSAIATVQSGNRDILKDLSDLQPERLLEKLGASTAKATPEIHGSVGILFGFPRCAIPFYQALTSPLAEEAIARIGSGEIGSELPLRHRELMKYHEFDLSIRRAWAEEVLGLLGERDAEGGSRFELVVHLWSLTVRFGIEGYQWADRFDSAGSRMVHNALHGMGLEPLD